MTTVAEQVVQEYLAREGTRESPPGSNCVPGITDTYPASAVGCAYWCAMALSVLAYNAANTLGIGPAGYLPDMAGYGPGSAYVPHFTNWAEANNLWIDPHVAQPGDIIIFGDSDHIGVTRGPMDATGWIPTIEGNTSVQNGTGEQANGEYIAARYRHQSWVKGVLRPPMWQLDSSGGSATAVPTDPWEILMADTTNIDSLNEIKAQMAEIHAWAFQWPATHAPTPGQATNNGELYDQAWQASTYAAEMKDKVDLLLARVDALQAPSGTPTSGPSPPTPAPAPAPVAEKTLGDFPEDEVIAFALPLIEQRLGFGKTPA